MGLQNTSFSKHSELANEFVTSEQIARAYQRYKWAAGYASGRRTLEVACGAGLGIKLISNVSSNFVGCDYDDEMLKIALQNNPHTALCRAAADGLPFRNNSFDVLLLLEAIYFLPDVNAFLQEARRTLRPDGWLLIASANKDVDGFIPSPVSTTYWGVMEMSRQLSSAGFTSKCYGGYPLESITLRQKLFQPARRFAKLTHTLLPTKAVKNLAKRIVFGPLTRMPASLLEPDIPVPVPRDLPSDRPDHKHKVIFFAAQPSR